MRRLSALCCVAILGCWTAGVRAEDANRPLDNDFLIKVATCDNKEVEIGKLADKRAESPKVKEYAAQLVRDHQKNADRVAELLKNRKLGVVSGLEKDVRAEIDRLSKLQGKEFDREFVNCMVKGHKEAIAVFENEGKNGKDGDTRAFANETLPRLRDHLQQAEDLAKNVN